MKLREYIDWKKMKPYKWAEEVGLPSSLVYEWLSGVIPSAQNIQKISKATNDYVTFKDWINEDN